MSVEEHKALIGRYNEAFNRHDVDALASWLSDDTVFEDTSPAPDGRRIEGKAAVVAHWRDWFSRNADARFEAEDTIVAGDRVVVHARQADREIVRAVSLATAKEIWRDEYPTPYTMNPAARAHGPGPKSTPIIAGTRVVTFGISGILSAFDLESGKVLWRTPAPSAAAEYGTAMSPIVDGPLVIAYMSGADTGGLTAFDLARNTRVRRGIERPAMTDDEIRTWLRDL